MLQKHAFWCPERWKSHFQASRFQFFLGAWPQTHQGERGLAAPLVVTATYYTFSGPL